MRSGRTGDTRTVPCTSRIPFWHWPFCLRDQHSSRGEMYLLLRFSDEDVEWAMAVPEAGGLWKDGFCFGGRYLFLFAHLFLFNI